MKLLTEIASKSRRHLAHRIVRTWREGETRENAGLTARARQVTGDVDGDGMDPAARYATHASERSGGNDGLNLGGQISVERINLAFEPAPWRTMQIKECWNATDTWSFRRQVCLGCGPHHNDFRSGPPCHGDPLQDLLARQHPLRGERASGQDRFHASAMQVSEHGAVVPKRAGQCCLVTDSSPRCTGTANRARSGDCIAWCA